MCAKMNVLGREMERFREKEVKKRKGHSPRSSHSPALLSLSMFVFALQTLHHSVALPRFIYWSKSHEVISQILLQA